jgi:hypothetical protein
MTRKPPPDDERLQELGRKWFSEVREQRVHDDAEMENWQAERRKWNGHRNDPTRVFEDYWLRGGSEDSEPSPQPPRPPQLKRSGR